MRPKAVGLVTWNHTTRLDYEEALMVGEDVSHYRIVEKLRGGGMGVAYKAEDTKLHCFVA
jgi:hypothetical protein